MNLYVNTKWIRRTGALSAYTVSCKKYTDFPLPSCSVNILSWILNSSRFSFNFSWGLWDNWVWEVNRSCFNISIVTVDSKVLKVDLVNYWIKLLRANSKKLCFCHWFCRQLEVYISYGVYLKSKCREGY